MEVRNSNHEVRLKDNQITGLASVFYDGTPQTEYELWKGAVERIDGKAFDRALSEGHDVRALYNHNPDHLLGRTSAGTLTLRKDAKGLRYFVPFDESDEDHRRVKSKIERGDLTGSSFAFRVTKEEWTEEEGRDVRIVKDVQLIDVGPVTFPAYEATSAGVRSEDHLVEARSKWNDWQIERLKTETQKRLQNLAAMTNL